MKQYAALSPLYGVGGTAIGGYEPLPLVEAPYLPPLKNKENTYTLVLDLDETLVHYFEVSSRLFTHLGWKRGAFLSEAWLRCVPQRDE